MAAGLQQIRPLDLPASLWQRIFKSMPQEDMIRSRAVCEEFDKAVCPLVRLLNLSSQISQSCLEHLGRSYTSLVSLSVELDYDDNMPSLDWATTHFPSLESLRLSCCPAKSLYFQPSNTPALRSLSISNQGPNGAEDFLTIALPELDSINFEFVTVSPKVLMLLVDWQR